MKNLFKICISACLLSLSLPLFAESEADPEDIIKYRQDVMNIIKHHNSSIKAIIRGNVPYRKHLDIHFMSMEMLFNEMDALFPEGSDFGDTAAKDEVWEKPEEFSKAIENARQALKEFKRAAWRGDKEQSEQARKQFGKDSCGGCHKKFRKKDE